MSEAVGPVHVEARGGGEWRPAPQTEALVDSEVKRLLAESYERVRALLRAHSAELHALANALLERETLTAGEARGRAGGGCGWRELPAGGVGGGRGRRGGTLRRRNVHLLFRRR